MLGQALKTLNLQNSLGTAPSISKKVSAIFANGAHAAQVNTSNCLAQVLFVADLQHHDYAAHLQDYEKGLVYQAIQIKCI